METQAMATKRQAATRIWRAARALLEAVSYGRRTPPNEDLARIDADLKLIALEDHALRSIYDGDPNALARFSKQALGAIAEYATTIPDV